VLSPTSGASANWEIEPVIDEAWRAAVERYGKIPSSYRELENVEFVQLFNLDEDPAETTDVASQHPGKVAELFKLFYGQVENGRTRPGEPLQNAVPVQPFRMVPQFVLDNIQ
jgi:hypothetical protein